MRYIASFWTNGPFEAETVRKRGQEGGGEQTSRNTMGALGLVALFSQQFTPQ